MNTSAPKSATQDEVNSRLRVHLRNVISNAQHALKMLDGECDDTPDMGPGSRLKNLGRHIVETLRASAVPMTSEEIARKLYSDRMDISWDLFKRRVIVTTSAMYRANAGQVVPAINVSKGKEKAWTLPEYLKHEDRPKAVLHVEGDAMEVRLK